MERFNYSFLKEENGDLWGLVYEAERNLYTEPNTSLIKLRQIAEYMVKKILDNERKSFLGVSRNLHDKIEELKTLASLPSNFIALFEKIRLEGNKAIHEGFQDMNSASNLFNSLFEPLSWFVITYGIADYLKYTQDMGLEEKVVFQSYLLQKKQTKNHDEYVRTNIQNEIEKDHTLIDAFDLGNIQRIAPKYDAFSKYKKDVFETDGEFKKRVAEYPPIAVGAAFLDFSKIKTSSGFLLFSCALDQSLPVKNTAPDVLYVEVAKLPNAEGILKCPIYSTLIVREGIVWINSTTYELKIGDSYIPCNALYFSQHSYESEVEYTSRISKIPILNIGIVELQSTDYNIELEKFPVKIIPYKWADVISQNDKKSLISIDRKRARELYSQGVYHPVFAQFSILNNKIHLVNLKIVVDSHSYALAGLAEKKTFETYKLALKGDTVSQAALGDIFCKGLGATANNEYAAKWYKKAAKKGNTLAILSLYELHRSGLIKEDNQQEVFNWYSKAAEIGNNEAQYEVALIYLKGNNTININYKEAWRWLEKAANSGIDKAWKQLFNLYNLKLVSISQEKMLDLLVKAVQLGITDAKTQLIEFYKKQEFKNTAKSNPKKTTLEDKTKINEVDSSWKTKNYPGSTRFLLRKINDDNVEKIISKMTLKDSVKIKRKYTNLNKHLINVYDGSDRQLGTLPNEIASYVNKMMDKGINYDAKIIGAFGDGLEILIWQTNILSGNCTSSQVSSPKVQQVDTSWNTKSYLEKSAQISSRKAIPSYSPKINEVDNSWKTKDYPGKTRFMLRKVNDEKVDKIINKMTLKDTVKIKRDNIKFNVRVINVYDGLDRLLGALPNEIATYVNRMMDKGINYDAKIIGAFGDNLEILIWEKKGLAGKFGLFGKR